MPYATLSDLIERASETEIRQIADRDRDGVPDAEVIASALADADNLINGYIAARYSLPLPSVPDLVRTWAVSIARHMLHRNGSPERVKDDYGDALAALKDVSRGTASLPFAAGDAKPSANSGSVMASHPPKVFTRPKLRGWR